MITIRNDGFNVSENIGIFCGCNTFFIIRGARRDSLEIDFLSVIFQDSFEVYIINDSAGFELTFGILKITTSLSKRAF